jgi:hypothetical protein
MDEEAKSPLRLWFSDFWHETTVEKIKTENPIYELLARRWQIILDPKKPDFIICSAYGCEYLKWQVPRIYYTPENFRPLLHLNDYSFTFDWPITERNYRLPYYRLNELYEDVKLPRQIPSDFETRKFCCFLVSNPRAKERLHMFELLSAYKKVDSGGKVLNNIGYQLGPSQAEKMEWMQGYKFALVFENSSYPGYTTEKLIEALLCNTIPIYWGNPRIAEDFNPQAFINVHDYPDFEAVVQKVIEVDQDSDLANRYLSASYLPDGKEADYLKEEVILQRFEHIFSSGKAFVPRWKKRLQIINYPIKMGKRHGQALLEKLKKLPGRVGNKVRRLTSK